MISIIYATFCHAVFANTSSIQKNNHATAINLSVVKSLKAKELTIPLSNETELCDINQPEIRFKPHTIFNEKEKGIFFLHRWANAIHIKTKIITLENEANFFMKKCIKTDNDMAELERHLRSRKYLKDAAVSNDSHNKLITITTWDNWSLTPTVSFGRKGGVQTHSLGIKERNLFGLGINTEIATYRNIQRSGYKLIANVPLFQKQNSSVNLKFADNDDGQQRSLFFDKTFPSFRTKKAYEIGFNDESRNDTLFQNGQEQSIYRHKIRFKEASYAWLKFNNSKSLLRYRLGATQSEDRFSQREENIDIEQPVLTTEIPANRVSLYGWLAIKYIKKNFKKLNKIYSINQIEDFNLGWQVSSRFGLGNEKEYSSTWIQWNTRVKKGFNLHNNALLLLDLTLNNDIYEHRDNRLLIELKSEYFYKINEKFGFYLSNINVISKNEYRDKPVTIGGDTGLRGFPLQYQHGQNSVKLTSEIRYYPQINIFKLFDLAGVAFIDLGRTFGKSMVKNREEGWLSSIGLGLRLNSPHSGGSNSIIHIDFTLPQSENKDVNGFEIRLQAKRAF